jgi:hypothetical protein
MANADYRSNSAQPVIVKILSDYADWTELVKADQYRKQYFEKRNKEMVLKPSSDASKNDTSAAVTKSKDEPAGKDQSSPVKPEEVSKPKDEQFGSGIGDILSKITECVRGVIKEELIKHFGRFKLDEQVGRGAEDLVERPPQLIEKDVELLAGDTSENKNINEWTSKADVDKLVNSVPPGDRRRARELIDFFLSNPLLVSWDAIGRVTIGGTTIPLSNIYTLFKQLYLTKPDKTVPGYFSLSSFILSTGKKSLTNVTSKYFTRSAKRDYPLNLDDFDEQKPAPKRPWYFIGDLPDN